ncbi:MAG: hypothetical protein KJI71_01585 [Patescibacteria group bacterium]|nr:hypothetical protein [Patescibacteria group bacterium]
MEKIGKLIAEEFEEFKDGSVLHSQLFCRPLTPTEIEERRTEEGERQQRIEFYRLRCKQIRDKMPKTKEEKLEHLKKGSAKYNHKYPILNPDFPHACKECYYYRFYYDFGYIDFGKNQDSCEIDFEGEIRIVGSIKHICDFNGPVEIGIRTKRCKYYTLRKLEEFRRFLTFNVLDWSGYYKRGTGS